LGRDPGKRLHQSEGLGLRQLIEYGAPRRIVRPIGPFEEIGNFYPKDARDFQQSASAYPVGALLVSLQLLERHAECIRKLRLREPFRQTKNADITAYELVDRVRSSTSHLSTPGKAARG
jgi:hypothetical protein